ncbi:MAG: MlaE family lipid ABC transporter permease subunit [Phycisphaerales bacterium]|nr:MAG: MlaE family lipid ABC transporter permease subunit [Phycisphaerales bacterium]
MAKKADATRLQVEEPTKDGIRMVVQGRLDADHCAPMWKEARRSLEKLRPKTLTVDAAGVDYCDGAGAGFIFNLREYQERAQRGFEIEGLQERIRRLLEMFDPGEPPPLEPREGPLRTGLEDIGRGVAGLAADALTLVAFTGELTASMVAVLPRPHKLRWKDAFLVMERAGCDAFGIVALVSFLFGAILAFQATIPMERFGVAIYVVNIVGIGVTRELGPIMTAIILAGRTGSAFAAELGTMKVSEELNALDTMGLEPVQFLIVPRVIAAILMMPLLVVLSNFAAIVGGLLVMRSVGYTWVTLIDQLQGAVDLNDLFCGLFKSFFFGLLVAGIGCLRGLQTATGAQAVGVSATRAVVSGIFLILFADSVFSVVFYTLGI